MNEPQEFYFEDPIWVIADAGTIHIAEDGEPLLVNAKGALRMEFDQGKAVAIFTDYESAERYFAEEGGGSPATFIDWQRFVWFLETVEKDGCSLVAFDPRPGEGKEVRFLEIRSFIEGLRQKLGCIDPHPDGI